MASAYDRYGRIAYSLLVRITRNQSSAEDLLQEVFLRVWTRSRAFDPGKGSLGVWILSIARYLAVDNVRSAQTRFTTRLRPLDTVDLFYSDNAGGARGCVIENIHIVRAAFSALNLNQQRVLELAYFEGYSQSEIAARLHKPLGTVKSWMRSGLSRMRTAMNGNPKPPPKGVGCRRFTFPARIIH